MNDKKALQLRVWGDDSVLRQNLFDALVETFDYLALTNELDDFVYSLTKKGYRIVKIKER